MRLSFEPWRTGMLAAWLIVVASLSACKNKDTAPAPPVAPSASASHRPGCPGGHSLDPPKAEFRPAIGALRDKRYREAQRLLGNLCEKYPNSATARVWMGDAVLYDSEKDYVASADEALKHYDRAHALVDAGCNMREVMHYYLLMGTAYAYLRKDRAEPAESHLTIAQKRWPDSAEVTYHLARAHCLREQFDQCLMYLERTFQLAKERKRPLFLRVHRALDDWFVRTETQSEFAGLRNQRPRELEQLKEKYRAR